jgi:uncharacterized tellurite resistance protein B-like protein
MIVAIIAALGGAIWAAIYFLNAAREGGEAIRDVKGMVRNARWSRKIDARLIESLEDPREAAAILLYQIAAYDGAVTERQRLAMVSEMRRAFSVDAEEAEGLFAFARMAAGQINDAGNSLRKIARPVLAACNDAERRDLIDMLLRIAEVEGPVSEMQNRLVAEARRVLLEPMR